MKISQQEARNTAIESQFLHRDDLFSGGKEGTIDVIDKLGYIQIDTISVIERAHHHTIFTRNPDYEKQHLHELHAPDKLIFEYWGHAASFLPMKDFRYYLPMKRNFPGKSSWNRKLFEQHKKLYKPILKRIKEEGALTSADFKHPERKNKNAWWEWKPSKTALEMLFFKGELMIKERRNFRKVYDLTERVLPDNVDLRMPSQDELGNFFVRRALNSYGIATENEIVKHITAVDRQTIRKGIELLLESGEIVRLEIERSGKKNYYALKNRLENESPNLLHILSPFDNFIIQRERIKDLFNFDYALECYVPNKKRKFGYFVLPILWKNEFIGRIDLKTERNKKQCIIQNLFFEDDFNDLEQAFPQLRRKLRSLAEFNRCEEIKFSDKKMKIPSLLS